MTGHSRSLDQSRQQNRDDQRRFSGSLGVVAGSVVLYLFAHRVWQANEPGRVLWVGTVGTMLEWAWWGLIGVAVRALTTAAHSFLKLSGTSPPSTARRPSLPGLLYAVLLVLLSRCSVFRGAESPMFLDFNADMLSSEILVPSAFVLGFFNLLSVVHLRSGARSTRDVLVRAYDSLDERRQDFFRGARAMWRDIFRL